MLQPDDKLTYFFRQEVEIKDVIMWIYRPRPCNFIEKRSNTNVFQ